MNLNFLHDNNRIRLITPCEKKKFWFKCFHFRRKPNSEEEINEIHDLIFNVYESIDDKNRAVLLSLSKIIQDDDESITIEEKIKAIIAMGHSICCGHLHVKNSIQLYTKLFVQTLSHNDLRMRLAAIIAIGEASIDNLCFQMKLNEIDMLPKLFNIMKTSIPYAGRTLDNINEHTKLIAWSCYTIVNICANCLPNILLLKNIIPMEFDTLRDATQMEIWFYVWRENYAQTILQFIDNESTSTIPSNSIQPKTYSIENHISSIEQISNERLSSRTLLSFNYRKCIVM